MSVPKVTVAPASDSFVPMPVVLDASGVPTLAYSVCIHPLDSSAPGLDVDPAAWRVSVAEPAGQGVWIGPGTDLELPSGWYWASIALPADEDGHIEIRERIAQVQVTGRQGSANTPGGGIDGGFLG